MFVCEYHVGLVDAMREGATEDDVLAFTSAAVNRKKAVHTGMSVLHRVKKRQMSRIGKLFKNSTW